MNGFFVKFYTEIFFREEEWKFHKYLSYWFRHLSALVKFQTCFNHFLDEFIGIEYLIFSSFNR